MHINRHQLGVLIRRYTQIILGDFRGILSLFVQVLLIAVAIIGVWRNWRGDSLSLYFVLCLCSFFFGSINSCREIVKERNLFLRERMFNLSVPAYLLSKYGVQFFISLLQNILLVLLVWAFIPLDVSTVVIIIVLFGVGSAGICVGLLVSAVVKSSDKAVVCVPLLVIPQILFSDFVLGAEQLSNWTGHAQDVMPVYWGFDVLKQFWKDDLIWGNVLLSAVAFLLVLSATYFLTALRLSSVRD